MRRTRTVYAINRYYSPDTGRFTTHDPLTELDRPERLNQPQGLNLYPYVMGGPTRYTDPDGLDWRRKDAADASGLHPVEWFAPADVTDGWSPVPNGYTYVSPVNGWTYTVFDDHTYRAQPPIPPPPPEPVTTGDVKPKVANESDGVWSYVQNGGNFAAGFGDQFMIIGMPGPLSYNFSGDIRRWLGTERLVDRNSDAYTIGWFAHFAWWAALGGGMWAAEGRGAGLTTIFPEGVPTTISVGPVAVADDAASVTEGAGSRFLQDPDVETSLREAARKLRESTFESSKYHEEWLVEPPTGKGNVATSQTVLDDGITLWKDGATSRANSPLPNPRTPSEGGFEPTFAPEQGRIPGTDSEHKILDAIAKRLEALPESQRKGTVYIYTERAPCGSCRSIVDQFERRFGRNVKVHIYWRWPFGVQP